MINEYQSFDSERRRPERERNKNVFRKAAETIHKLYYSDDIGNKLHFIFHQFKK